MTTKLKIGGSAARISTPRNGSEFGKLCMSSLVAALIESVVLLFITVGAALAQTASTGALAGTITDPMGVVTPGVLIKVTNETTGESRDSTSRRDGTYLIPLLSPGSYRMELSMPGFKPTTISGIKVDVTETRTINLKLDLGVVKETISVEANAPTVQTESSALGRITDQKTVQGLPLVTRNFTQIIGLSSGVDVGVTDAGQLGRGSGGQSFAAGGFSVNGARPYDNNFQMDGVSANDLMGAGDFSGGVAIPNPDSIEEFKVQTGQYDATYGRNAGANVNVVTKSGSNEFHGRLFEFFRNEALNANSYFFNAAHQPRGVLRQNQFGGAIGGPIKKDKLLFFGSYQGMRQRNGISANCSSTFSGPPLTNDRTAAGLGSLFAGQRGLFQNAFGGVGPAVAADGSNINPVALKLLQLKQPDGSYVFPTPQSVTSGVGNYAISAPCTFNEDQFVTNADFQQTAKSQFKVKFFFADSNQHLTLPSGAVAGPQNVINHFRNVTLTHNYIFSSTLLNQVQFGFHNTLARISTSAPFNFSDVGIAATPQANSLPEFRIGPEIVGVFFPSTVNQDAFVFQDTLSYVRGRHSFRFGGGVSPTTIRFADFNSPGILIFLSFPDFLLGLPAGPAGNGTPFSNVFGSLDIPGTTDRDYVIWQRSLYAQDDVRFGRLVLNAGFRYERLGDFGETNGRNGGFDISNANPNPPASGSQAGFVVSSNLAGTQPPGVSSSGNRLGIRGVGQNTYGPRLGFALQVFPHSRHLVIRGGFGSYFTTLVGQQYTQIAFVPPFAQQRFVLGAANAAATLANPFALPGPASFPVFPSYSPRTALSTRYLGQDYRPSIAQQYSLNLQSELAKDFLLEVGYVGSRGTHLLRTLSQNQANLASSSNPIRGETTNTLANVRLRVPVQGFAPDGLQQLSTEGASWYNSLQASLNKRFGHGLQFLASYTYARALDTDGANVIATAGGATLGIGDQNNDRARYGTSNLIRPHRFVVSYFYNFPNKAGAGFAAHLLNNWALAGVTTFQAGQPLTITDTNAKNVFGITGDRAALAPGCTSGQLATSGSVTSRLTHYFNSACLGAYPVVGNDGIATGFGNSGIGAVRGPDQRNSDFALIKLFPISWGRETNIEFRAEFFNAFNTPQFGNPGTSRSTASSFGRITSTTVNPRIVQFALKLSF